MREPRCVLHVNAVPKDFLRILRRSGLDEFFLECPYVHRADYLSWIAATKRPATRQLRIHKAVVRLFAQWMEEMTAARAGIFSGECEEKKSFNDDTSASENRDGHSHRCSEGRAVLRNAPCFIPLTVQTGAMRRTRSSC